MKLLWIAILLTLPLVAAIDKPVKVEGGLVSGVPGSKHPSITAFKGIPFAAPPVGEGRWRAPGRLKPWNGVRKAGNFGPSCIQRIVEELKPWTYEFMTHNEIAEDCLYLNLWTGDRSTREKRPVFVYIYGGGFNSGSGQVPVYDGEGLAAKGIIVVSMNYRVGVLGFLGGNWGILDQIAALRWIKDNIARFGGDPNRVTIAGQSAGAASVHILTASPLAKGLFHRAIAESGSSLPRGNDQAPVDPAKFAEAKGVHSLDDLRALSWQKVVEPVPGMRFRPIAAAGPHNDVVTLTGCNKDEGVPERARVSMYLWAMNRAKTAKTKTYTYFWTHTLPGPESAVYGAFHTSEVPYVFNTLYMSNRPFVDEDHKIADTMSSYWANFVKTGDPNGKGLAKWEPVSAKHETMELGDRFAAIPLTESEERFKVLESELLK